MEEKDNAVVEEKSETVAEQGAEAQEEKGSKSTAPLGKFENADALLKAYNSLQAEFTRRSQRLKELEKAEEKNNAERAKTVPTPESAASDPSAPPEAMPQEEDLFLRANADPAVREKIIGAYFAELQKGAVPLMQNGAAAPCPPDRPKNLAQAGKLALGYFQSGSRK